MNYSSFNPSSGYYSDTKSSAQDARFWSSLACFQASDIEGGEKVTISRGFSNRVDKPYRPTTRRPPSRIIQKIIDRKVTDRLSDYEYDNQDELYNNNLPGWAG